MTITDVDRATPFSLIGTELLESGQTQTLLANAPQLWLHAKVYAGGGENSLHAHPREDHAFFILAGEATFLDAEGNETVCGPYQGILIPRGVHYSFHCTSDENLVALRIGAGQDGSAHGRKGIDESPIKTAGTGVPIPGKVFTG
jgi:mannose-6-phosphate isomerase-like protein (cupin superfamily)